METEGTVPPPGYSSEKISFALELDQNGRPLRLADKRSYANGKPVPVSRNVPAGVIRASGIKPNLLWDKTAYVFGVIAKEVETKDGKMVREPGQGRRTLKEHTAFVAKHKEFLAGAIDPGLVALRGFLDWWQPEKYAELGFSLDALDQNVVFEFNDGTGPGFIHDRSAANALLQPPPSRSKDLCLVSGEHAPIQRLHPKIKGVMGAQSTGASLVSFNSDAYESFGKSQGDNAPVSERVAFAYGAALNSLLAKGSERNLRVGDTTVVFWAETKKREVVELTELFVSGCFQPPDEDAESRKLLAGIKDVATGRPTIPNLDPATRIFMLGLAPNAARLSVRFWYPGTFGDFARHVARFWDDLQFEPAPWKGPPAAWSLLYETAIRVSGKAKANTIQPLLGGQVMRSILTGRPLPRTLLTAVIARIRADGDISSRRAAICRAVINRTTKKEEIPVSLNLNSNDPAYRLGRLFARLELAQAKAHPSLNATIKDRYFAAASATPARVFPMLVKNATHHLALLKKGENPGLGHWLEKELGEIWLEIDADMPRSLSLEDQGRFIAGYYHQRWTKTVSDKEGDTLPENQEASND